MVGGIAICGGSEDVREGRMGIGGGGCGMIGGMLAPAISGRRNHDATEAHCNKKKKMHVRQSNISKMACLLYFLR